MDLRACIQAVTDCSPELAGQDCDYTIYAVDFSEPNTPLVGQGMLSWALDTLLRGDMSAQPKLVTGRVTKNLLGVFSGGNKETLEVTLRLTAGANKTMQWAADSFDMQAAMTPTGASEWNSFLQSNPQIGDQSHISRVASPAMSQGPPASLARRDSFGPGVLHNADGMGVQRIAPVPVDASTMPNLPGGSSRPSSRTSNRAPRKRQPTGRPRGRPRKKPVEGNTSGYEDGTEGEDGPAKKRVKTTKVERVVNPFTAGSESLRVAASTSGSIRNFRPLNTEGSAEGSAANHLQEVPRAPTPVPNGPVFPGQRGKVRRESTLSQKPMTIAPYPGPQRPLSPSQEDGRSPESAEPTPNYSEDSPGDIGSSPPVARATPYLRSSPPPSSPMLPPMPTAKRDASFLSENMDDLFGDEAALPPPRVESRAVFTQQPPRKPRPAKQPTGIPVSVFQMQDGPGGQDLVHICSYNSPPLNPPSTSRPLAPAPPPPTQTVSHEQPSLPPLKQQRPSSKPKASAATSPPIQEPTPPPTTDAVDKAPSPVLAAEAAQAGPSTLPEESARAAKVQRPSSAEAAKPSSQMPSLASKPRRPLARSQSAGPLLLPAIPASEPIGPSSLSQSFMPEQAQRRPDTAAPLRRESCHGPISVPVPASDPAGPAPSAVQPPNVSFSEAPCPPSEPVLPPPSSPQGTKSNKNVVKKHAIRARLEEAIMNGEMPPFCNNCGAIETPTWRKIWVQEREGIPEPVQFSEKPGKITAIEITERGDDEEPTKYRVTKKGLGPTDDKRDWQELLLCNPCGIWLTKCKAHRPRDRWDRDASRLGQERKRRNTGRSTSRAKKGRKTDAVANPTSEAYLHTDAIGPVEPSSPKLAESLEDQSFKAAPLAQPGSTHSTVTAKSPVNPELDAAMGVTKRLLFPSPRKDGSPKILGDLKVNLVQTMVDQHQDKLPADGKENMGSLKESKSQDELEALFRSPGPARPSTPPPNAKSAPSANFKTPTQPTPSHRPITRSVSRSIRSVRSILASPSHLALLQRTPTKTPRPTLAVPDSASRRRSPRNHQTAFEVFDTPITRTINQMLSEPNGFGLDTNDLDLGNLPTLDNHQSFMDFGNFLSTDGIMPSSPPKAGSLAFDYEDSDVWATWGVDGVNSLEE